MSGEQRVLCEVIPARGVVKAGARNIEGKKRQDVLKREKKIKSRGEVVEVPKRRKLLPSAYGFVLKGMDDGTHSEGQDRWP